jgi:sn-glycerol 3-phosphate transport system permease protein
VTGPHAGAPARGRRLLPLRRAARYRGYLFILPALVVFGVFFYYALGFNLYLSVSSWNLVSPERRFVGLANYRVVMTSPRFHRTLVNTGVYTAGSTLCSMVAGLALALALRHPTRPARLLQGVLFTPYVISWVSVALLWLWLLDPQYGLIDAALARLGLPAVNWLGAEGTALWSLVILTVWKTVGYDMLVYLGGLQAIPSDVYEAASLDGAGRLAQVFRITLPLLSPTVFFLVVTSVIFSFEAFDIVNIMTQGGPIHDATSLFVYFIYVVGFQYFQIGQAAAASVLLFVILLVLTVLEFQFLQRSVHYAA